MVDLIDRQAAIEETWKEPSYADPLNVLTEMRDRLRALPSAQPEIIYCKDCKFTDGEKPIADGRHWCVLHESFMYYCSDAERRTDG